MVEAVVLLDETGTPSGVADKHEVHHGRTPLHLGFSCYVLDADDRLLVTRRAVSKRTFPGVLTNSFCGHPLPGESLDDAVRRRAAHELGLGLGPVRTVLPSFRYRAQMDGVVELEMCPVTTARVEDGARPEPRPDEVAHWEWVPWARFAADVLAGRLEVSPWCAEQVGALVRLGPPDTWPDEPARLPPALRAPHVVSRPGRPGASPRPAVRPGEGWTGPLPGAGS